MGGWDLTDTDIWEVAGGAGIQDGRSVCGGGSAGVCGVACWTSAEGRGV